MAKKPTSSCLFCGTNPCSCFGTDKPKKAPKPRPKKKVETKPEDPWDEPRGTPIEEPWQDEAPKFKAIIKEERDLSLVQALRLLRPIVSREDQKMIDEIVNPPYPQDVDRRMAEWRRLHVDSGENFRKAQDERERARRDVR